MREPKRTEERKSIQIQSESDKPEQCIVQTHSITQSHKHTHVEHSHSHVLTHTHTSWNVLVYLHKEALQPPQSILKF